MESPLEVTLGVRLDAYLTSPGDFRKLRKSTNRRLLKLRHALGLVTRDTKNYRKKQRTLTILASEYAKDPRYALMPLLTAERDLLFAQEIKARMEISADAVASFAPLMLTRMKRAVTNSKRLLAIVAGESSRLVLLEYFTYACLTQGQYSVLKKRWNDALNAFAIARCIVDYLYAVGASTDTEWESDNTKRALLRDLLDQIIDPAVNLLANQLLGSVTDTKSIARHHCHDDRFAYLSPAILILESLDPSFTLPISLLELVQSIQWRGHTARLYNDEIAYKLMQLESTASYDTYDTNQFDELISQWLDVLQIHQDQMAKGAVEDADDAERVRDTAILETYLNYNILFTRVMRDNTLLAELQSKLPQQARLKDCARVFSSMKATVEELKNLPGVYNDQELYLSLEQLHSYYTHQHNYVLALLFQAASRPMELLRVLDHIATEFCLKVVPFQACFPYGACTNAQVEAFCNKVQHQKVQAHIMAQLVRDISPKTTTGNAIVENVGAYPLASLADAVKIDHASLIRPVPCKPVLFDIAFNYLSYDLGRTAVKQSPATASDPIDPQAGDRKRGFFGMFGR